ncbi:MAG: DUF2442 domain-containing protein [Thermoanaerobacteraceae bacterium]|nr:DUF2442 domain-containing protein [Thermoanaerobacteraceae bacterium]
MEAEYLKTKLKFRPLKTKLIDGYYIEEHFTPPGERTQIKGVFFGRESIHILLTDGREIITPLSWFPVLEKATTEQRLKFTIGRNGRSIHWDDLDEDLPLEVFLDQY